MFDKFDILTELKKAGVIKSIILVVCVLTLASLFTVAWVSSRKKVESEGMLTNVKVSNNLVIDTTTAGVAEGDNRSITFTDTLVNLLAASHDDGQYTDGVLNSNKSGLVYNTNPGAVSNTTGLNTGTEVLTFDEVPVESPSKYYKDFVLYLAARPEDMAISSLDIAMSSSTELSEATQYVNAVSADVYLGNTYKGTLNIAGYSNDNSGSTKTSLNLMKNSTVPGFKSTSDKYLKVTLRMYFDGGLIDQEDTTKTYVHAYKLVLGKFDTCFSFIATEPAK